MKTDTWHGVFGPIKRSTFCPIIEMEPSQSTAKNTRLSCCSQDLFNFEAARLRDLNPELNEDIEDPAKVSNKNGRRVLTQM